MTIGTVRFPRRYAPLVYGVIQAAITSAVATGIATYKLGDSGMALMMFWAKTWFLAWLTMLPVVVLVAPMIQKAVIAMTIADSEPDQFSENR